MDDHDANRMKALLACKLISFQSTPTLQCLFLPFWSPHSSWKLLLRFVAGHKLDTLEGKIGVPVIGLMGSGKSTTIAVQLGAEYRADDAGSLQLVYSPVATPQTSEGMRSQTLQVRGFQARNEDWMYLDTAGLNERRGDVYSRWTSWCSSMILSTLREIKAVMVVIDMNQCFGGRGETLRALAKSVDRVVGEGDKSKCMLENMLFVITNAWSNGKKIALPKLQQKVKACLADLDKEIEEFKQKHGHRTLKSCGLLAIEEKDLDEKQLESLKEIYSTQKLLETLLAAVASDKVLLSVLQTERDCREQKWQLGEKIKAMHGVKDDQQEALVRFRQSRSLDVNNDIAHLLTCELMKNRSFIDVLTQYLDYVEEYLNTIQENEHKLKFAEETNFTIVKEDEIRKTKERLTSEQKKCSQAQQEIDRLKESTKEEVVKTVEIREDAGFMSGWLGRKMKKEFETDLKKSEDYTRYELVKNSSSNAGCMLIVHCEDPLKIVLSSNSGISVDVKFYCEERKLQSTKERIGQLSREVANSSQVTEHIETNLQLLRSASERSDLVKVMVQQLPVLEKKMMQLRKEVNDQELPESVQPECGLKHEWKLTEAHVHDGLMRLVPTMTRTVGGMSDDLPASAKDSIEQFKELCDKLAKCKTKWQELPHCTNHLFCPAFEGLSLCSDFAPELDEQDVAKDGLLGAAGRFLLAAKTFCWTSGIGIGTYVSSMEWLQEHQLEKGSFMLVVAFVKDSTWLGWFILWCLKVFGGFLVLSHLFRIIPLAWERGVTRMEVFVSGMLETVAVEMRHGAEAGMQDLGGQLASRVNVDVNLQTERPAWQISALKTLLLLFPSLIQKWIYRPYMFKPQELDLSESGDLTGSSEFAMQKSLEHCSVPRTSDKLINAAINQIGVKWKLDTSILIFANFSESLSLS